MHKWVQKTMAVLNAGQDLIGKDLGADLKRSLSGSEEKESNKSPGGTSEGSQKRKKRRVGLGAVGTGFECEEEFLRAAEEATASLAEESGKKRASLLRTSLLRTSSICPETL